MKNLIQFGVLIFIFFLAFQNCGKVEVHKAADNEMINPEVVPGSEQQTTFDNKIISRDTLSCSIVNGDAKCWGAFPQLNNNKPLPDSLRPQKIPIFSYKIKSIANGTYNMCVLSQSGGVQCWGNRIGAGSELKSSATPVDVQGLSSGVTQIASGFYHTCALLNTGAVKCWGWLRPTVEDFSPVDIPGLTAGVKEITTGNLHTCALMNTGGVKCWGRANEYGQLGNGTFDPSTGGLEPTDVLGLTSGVLSISAGFNTTCALTTAGGMKCWGNNNQGQIGDSSFINAPTPKDVESFTSDVKAIGSGGVLTCALLTNNTVKCRRNNIISTITESSAQIRSLSVGTAHACILLTDGKIKCWGYNAYGQLGNNSTIDSQTPIPISE